MIMVVKIRPEKLGNNPVKEMPAPSTIMDRADNLCSFIIKIT